MKAETLLVFFVAAIFLQSKNVYGFNGNRIVNGSATPNGAFEYLLKLTNFIQEHGVKRKISGGTCSSTVISKRHILTAAHCVHISEPIHAESATTWNYRVDGFFIKPRYETVLDSPRNFWINKYSFQTKYYSHPSYTDAFRFYGDIAIIEFPENTNLNITPITLASNYVRQENDTGIIAGYGIYKWGYDPITEQLINPERPKVLQNATVPIHSTSPAYPYVIFAATIHRHGDEGDSGGPLMIERNGKIYQIGVASVKWDMDVWPYISNAYTRLSTYCDWITKITKGEAKCEPLPDVDPNPPPQPAPINPPAPPPPPGPSQDGTTTQAASNSNATDEASSQTPESNDKTEAPHHEPQNSKPNVAFTFNIVLLFLFIGFLAVA